MTLLIPLLLTVILAAAGDVDAKKQHCKPKKGTLGPRLTSFPGLGSENGSYQPWPTHHPGHHSGDGGHGPRPSRYTEDASKNGGGYEPWPTLSPGHDSGDGGYPDQPRPVDPRKKTCCQWRGNKQICHKIPRHGNCENACPNPPVPSNLPQPPAHSGSISIYIPLPSPSTSAPETCIANHQPCNPYEADQCCSGYCGCGISGVEGGRTEVSGLYFCIPEVQIPGPPKPPGPGPKPESSRLPQSSKTRSSRPSKTASLSHTGGAESSTSCIELVSGSASESTSYSVSITASVSPSPSSIVASETVSTVVSTAVSASPSESVTISNSASDPASPSVSASPSEPVVPSESAPISSSTSYSASISASASLSVPTESASASSSTSESSSSISASPSESEAPSQSQSASFPPSTSEPASPSSSVPEPSSLAPQPTSTAQPLPTCYNVFQNPSFETPDTTQGMPGPPWTPWDNFGETRNTNEAAHSGTRSFKNTSPWTNGLFTIFHDNIPLQPLSTYDLSFWVLHTATTSLPIRWYVYQLPAGTRMTTSTQPIAQGIMEQTTEWRKYEATVTAPDGGSWRFYIRFETPGSTRDVKDVWYLDDMELITYDGCTTGV